ncbi:zinc finger protein 182 [Ixodes scapularis]|uniref:zinc finger protein 182 n=1 Tax=Ixodes scapularis TaxID=6945 RepID=UPI001A9F840B|nr:zinc finger protein 182 [Ixodes scapularis]
MNSESLPFVLTKSVLCESFPSRSNAKSGSRGVISYLCRMRVSGKRFETVSTHRMAGPSLPPESVERSAVNVQVGSRDGLIERQLASLGVEEANTITKCCVPGELNEYEWTIARYEWILLIAKETTQKRGTGKVSQRGMAARRPGGGSFHAVNGGEAYRCGSCSYVTQRRGNMVTHQRTHTGERPFSCPHCPSEFAVKCTLKRHLLTHSAQRAFACSLCLDSFPSREELARHAQGHAGQRHFQCQFCPRSFGRRDGLLAHHCSHAGRRVHRCGRCSRLFSRNDDLVAHLATHAERP